MLQSRDHSPSSTLLRHLDQAELPHAKEYGIRGEQAVWRAVITQALMDASSNSEKSEMKYHKMEARRWLLDGGRDFVTVCEHAGLNASYVRQMARRALENDCQWRKEPARTRSDAGRSFGQRAMYHSHRGAFTPAHSPAPAHPQTPAPARTGAPAMVIPFSTHELVGA